MITAKGMRTFLNHMEDAGVLIPRPGQLRTWGAKISRKFPHATDADLEAAADILDERDDYIKLADLISILNNEPTEADKLDRANRIALVTAPTNGGELYPDVDLSPTQYAAWLKAARGYAAAEHLGMTPAEINAAARDYANTATDLPNTTPEIASNHAAPQLPNIRVI